MKGKFKFALKELAKLYGSFIVIYSRGKDCITVPGVLYIHMYIYPYYGCADLAV
jgi:hypothetical protein